MILAQGFLQISFSVSLCFFLGLLRFSGRPLCFQAIVSVVSCLLHPLVMCSGVDCHWSLACTFAEGHSSQSLLALPSSSKEIVLKQGTNAIGRSHQMESFQQLLAGARHLFRYVSRTHCELVLDTLASSILVRNLSGNALFVLSDQRHCSSADALPKGASCTLGVNEVLSFVRPGDTAGTYSVFLTFAIARRSAPHILGITALELPSEGSGGNNPCDDEHGDGQGNHGFCEGPIERPRSRSPARPQRQPQPQQRQPQPQDNSDIFYEGDPKVLLDFAGGSDWLYSISDGAIGMDLSPDQNIWQHVSCAMEKLLRNSSEWYVGVSADLEGRWQGPWARSHSNMGWRSMTVLHICRSGDTASKLEDKILEKYMLRGNCANRDIFGGRGVSLGSPQYVYIVWTGRESMPRLWRAGSNAGPSAALRYRMDFAKEEKASRLRDLWRR